MMKKEHCVCCIEGLQALEERLVRNDYIRLEDLSLCDTCRGILLISLEDAAMKGEQDANQES